MSPSRTVGSCISENKKFLEKLVKTKSQQKISKILSEATPEELYCLVETSFNIIKRNFPLPKRNLKKLTPYAPIVRELAKARTTKRAQKVLQKGSGFPFASLLIPILASVTK